MYPVYRYGRMSGRNRTVGYRIFHGNDALDHGQQNNGNDDELQQVDEDGADGLQVVGSESSVVSEEADQTDNNTENQSDQNLHGEG